MTIEIKQLVIRAIVEPRRDQAESPVARKPADATRGTPPSMKLVDRKALIADCTRAVLQELRRGRER